MQDGSTFLYIGPDSGQQRQYGPVTNVRRPTEGGWWGGGGANITGHTYKYKQLEKMLCNRCDNKLLFSYETIFDKYYFTIFITKINHFSFIIERA